MSLSADRPHRNGKSEASGPGVMSCEAVDELLLQYVRGLLPVAQANQVTDHLLHCHKHRQNHWLRFATVLDKDDDALGRQASSR